MKFHGRPLPRFTATVQLPRPEGQGPVLTLQPLPLGFSRQLKEHQVVAPQPPVRVARDPQGRPLRQANGQAVVMKDEQDAEYLAAVDLHQQRLAVLAIVESLKADPHVEFETQADDYPHDWRPYADRLCAELESAGWTAGDLAWLCGKICRLSNLLDAHLMESASDFSSGARSETDLPPDSDSRVRSTTTSCGPANAYI